MPKSNNGIYGLNSKVNRAVPGVSAVTSRNIIVATGSNNSDILGFITSIGFGQKRNIAHRYELGLEEVSYLAPGSIDGGSNIITVTKVLVFEGTLLEAFGTSYSRMALLQGADYQGNNGAPQSLLDFNMPFDVYVLRRGINSMPDDNLQTSVTLPVPSDNGVFPNLGNDSLQQAGLSALNYVSSSNSSVNESSAIRNSNQNSGMPPSSLRDSSKTSPYGLIIYRAFRECWFVDWKVLIDTAEGKMPPIIETANIMYTYMEGRPSNDPKLIHKIVQANNQVVALTSSGGAASSPNGISGGTAAIPVSQNQKGIQQAQSSTQSPAQIAGMSSNISKSTVNTQRQQVATTDINNRLDIMKTQQTQLNSLKLSGGDPATAAALENTLAIADKQVYQVAENGGVDSATLQSMMQSKGIEQGLYSNFYAGGSNDKTDEEKILSDVIDITKIQQSTADDITKAKLINQYENDIILNAKNGGVCKAKIISIAKSQSYNNFGSYLNSYVYGS